MEFDYRTRGTCSSSIHVALDGRRVKRVAFTGGCNGNLQGISRLVIGMKAEDAIRRMQGIRCGGKASSCPDQLSIALTRALEKEEKAQ